MSIFRDFVQHELWVNVPVAIFVGTVDCTNLFIPSLQLTNPLKYCWMQEVLRKVKLAFEYQQSLCNVYNMSGSVVWAFTISSRRREIVGAHTTTRRECCKLLVK